jgi:hypothetical protein
MPKYDGNAINSISAPRGANLYSTSLSCRNGRLDSDSTPAPALSPEPAPLMNTSQRYCTCTSSDPESVGPQPKQGGGPTGGDDYKRRWRYERRPVECRAVGVEWRPLDSLIACAALPGGVPAAMPETGLMAYQGLVGAEIAPVGAVCRCG